MLTSTYLKVGPIGVPPAVPGTSKMSWRVLERPCAEMATTAPSNWMVRSSYWSAKVCMLSSQLSPSFSSASRSRLFSTVSGPGGGEAGAIGVVASTAGLRVRRSRCGGRRRGCSRGAGAGAFANDADRDDDSEHDESGRTADEGHLRDRGSLSLKGQLGPELPRCPGEEAPALLFPLRDGPSFRAAEGLHRSRLGPALVVSHGSSVSWIARGCGSRGWYQPGRSN